MHPLLAGTVAAFLATSALGIVAATPVTAGPTAATPVAASLVAASLVATSRVVATPARADDGEPISCTIESTSPDSVSIGIVPQTVQFAVHTDCDGTYPVDWQMYSDQYVGSNASWLMMRNWDEPGAGKYTFVESPEGYFTIDPVHHGIHPGNAMAGEHPLYSSAFVDVDGNGYAGYESEPRTFGSTTFRLRRATTFGDSFAASSPAAEHHQMIHFTGSLQRADWDTGVYEDLGAWVTLQFQRSGSKHWRNVTRAWDDGVAHVIAEAKRSGTWRYHYDGDDISGSSDSESVFVDVGR